MMNKVVNIINETGLHARPASLLVKEASKYKCDIEIKKDGKSINAKSIVGILSLGIGKGETVSIDTNGVDEKEALDGIVALIESGFGE